MATGDNLKRDGRPSLLQIRYLIELKKLQPVKRGFQVVIAERCHVSRPGINFSPILYNPALPYIIITPEKEWQTILSDCLFHVYALLAAGKYADSDSLGRCVVKPVRSDCPEIEVHQDLIRIFQTL